MTDSLPEPSQEALKLFDKALKPRLEEEAKNASTVNQRMAVCGLTLCIILEPHEDAGQWALAETISGRQFYTAATSFTLLEESTLMVSELWIG